MADLIERLRQHDRIRLSITGTVSKETTFAEAADEIARLRAAIAPLVELGKRVKADAAGATKGPWRLSMGDVCVEGKDGDDRIIAGIGKSVGARSSVYEPIYIKRPEGAANARLILAAPDMAAALVALVEATDNKNGSEK